MSDDNQSVLPDWATVKLSNGLTHSRYARHVRIEQPSHSIKGRYTIGPAAVDHRPPLYDMPVEQVTRQTSSSASFETRSSAIQVEVWIMGDDDKLDASGELSHAATHRKGPSSSITKDGTLVSKNKPVSVAAKSYMGRISMSIVSVFCQGKCAHARSSPLTRLSDVHLQPQYTPSRPLHLRAKSHNGSLYIFLPPTFSGLVSWTADSGSLKLSHAIRDRYISLGENFKHRGTGMLLPRGQKKTEAHNKAAGKAKVVLEKKGLQPVGDGNEATQGSTQTSAPSTGGTNTPTTGSLSGASSVADLSSSFTSATERPAPTTASESPELGLPATAAATAAHASGTVTRGDACELITRNGAIHIYEVGEKGAGGSLADNCVVI